MKYIVSCLLGIVALISISCTEKETPGGVKYTVLRKGDGVEPELGKYLVMHMSLKDSKDSVWFESSETGFPIVVPVQDASMLKDEGEYGVFKSLTKGDSVSFELTASNIFTKTRKRPVPDKVDPLSLFKFNVGLQDVLSQAEVEEFQQKMIGDSERKRTKIDSLTIANFLKDKGMTALSTPSGLNYVIKQQGTGDNAKEGQTSYVNYAGYFLEGNLFDTNMESIAKDNNYDNGGRYSPYPVVVNTQSVIRGWDEMLLLMNKGMKVTVYVPSALAYGSQGRSPKIPPNSILMFDMEVVDIK